MLAGNQEATYASPFLLVRYERKHITMCGLRRMAVGTPGVALVWMWIMGALLM